MKLRAALVYLVRFITDHIEPGIVFMKRCAVICAFVMPLQHAAQANVDMNFRGILGADTCKLSTDSQDQLIEFPAIARSVFKNNPRSAPKKFSLNLLECDLSMGESVKVTFYGEESREQPGTFAITEGDAQGVAIAIESAGGEAIKPSVAMRPVMLMEDGNVLNFKAYIQGNDYEAIKEGQFVSSVKFILEYE